MGRSCEVKQLPEDLYQATPGRIAATRWLGLILASCVVFSMAPVALGGHFDLMEAPGWARLATLLAIMQVAFVLWMVSAADWASVWVVMLVFAAVSAIYAVATAFTLAVSTDTLMPLGLDAVRYSAPKWCGAVLAVMALATYFCGHSAAKWHRAATHCCPANRHGDVSRALDRDV